MAKHYSGVPPYGQHVTFIQAWTNSSFGLVADRRNDALLNSELGGFGLESCCQQSRQFEGIRMQGY